MDEENTPKKPEKCSICKKEYTTAHLEITPGVTVYACQRCQKNAEDNFIFLCMNCGTVHTRSKKLMINKFLERAKIAEASGLLERAGYYRDQAASYMQCEHIAIMQGIDMCISCDPEGIVNFVKGRK